MTHRVHKDTNPLTKSAINRRADEIAAAYNAPTRDGVPVERMSKALMEALIAKIDAGEIAASSKWLFRHDSPKQIYVRPREGDLTLCWYKRDPETGKSIPKPLGSYNDWKARSRWLDDLAENPGKTLSEIESVAASIDLSRALVPYSRQVEIEVLRPVTDLIIDVEPISDAETISELFAIYFESADFNGLKSARHIKALLNSYFLPAFGSAAWDSIKRKELREWRDALKDRKTVSVANRALAHAYGAVTWLTDNHFDEDNFSFPRLKLLPEVNRKMGPLPPLQLRALWYAAEQFKHQRRAALVKALILTGQRKTAVGGIRWDELEWDKHYQIHFLTIPAERSKSGKPYEIPIADSAVKILESQADIEEYVFPTDKGHLSLSGHDKADLETHMKAFLFEHGTNEKERELQYWRFHNLRKNYRTYSGMFCDNYTAELLIGHVLPTVTSSQTRYDFRDFKPDMVKAVKKTEEFILGICTGDISNSRKADESTDRVSFRDRRRQRMQNDTQKINSAHVR